MTRTLDTPGCERLGIDMPILQAPIGSATPELAAAVSHAGGHGALALSWTDLARARERIRRTHALSKQLHNARAALSPWWRATGLNPADFNANWRNLGDLRRPSVIGFLQGFSAESNAMQYRFTRERSLVQAQPCPSSRSADQIDEIMATESEATSVL